MDQADAKVTRNYRLPPAVIVDIDGTVARNDARSPYDWSQVGDDEPIENVIEIVESLDYAGYDIIFLSGRMGTEECRKRTKAWLDRNIKVFFQGPFMREDGDTRQDAVVKRELFDKHIRGNYDVVAVLDDRQQVVDMWRNELGLTCLQVAPGDF